MGTHGAKGHPPNRQSGLFFGKKSVRVGIISNPQNFIAYLLYSERYILVLNFGGYV